MFRSTRFVSYKFIDAKGQLRDKIVRSGAELQPTFFDGSSFGFCPTEKSDIILVPDPVSEFSDPIRNLDSVFCFVKTPDGNPLSNSYRWNAKLVMEQDEETRGALFGVEPEFFIIKFDSRSKQFIPIDLNHVGELDDEKQEDWYGCLPPKDTFQDLRYQIAEKLEEAGIDVEAIHHEVAPGQCEFSWKCDNLVRTADHMMLFKYIVSAVCKSHTYCADFRAKPYNNLNGNGCHVHQSIPSMFQNDQVVEKYAQGLVDHYDELLEVCCVGDTNSRRLVPGFEAPTKDNNGWGWHDRTKTVRIPGSGGRAEFRLPDPEMNPYVALPKMLEYGYKSVKE